MPNSTATEVSEGHVKFSGHKSQDATIATNVLVYTYNDSAPGIAHAMLSRVTNRSNLKIRGNLIPSDLIPFYLPYCRDPTFRNRNLLKLGFDIHAKSSHICNIVKITMQ